MSDYQLIAAPERKPIRDHSTLRDIKTGYGADDFQTPGYAIDWLMPFLDKRMSIWEPACGKGNLVRAFETAGMLDVVGTDILTGDDFLQAPECPEGRKIYNTYIITNPPFSGTNKLAFIERCYYFGCSFALLMPFGALEGIKRQALYREHGIQLLVPPRRIVFETPSGKKSSPWQAHAWFCWKLNLPSDLFFAEELPK